MRLMRRGHLTPGELVDLLDGHLSAARSSHAGSCETCRARAEDLRGMAEVTRHADVPEPSPLFWDRFSARVAETIRAEPAPSSWRRSLDWSRRAVPFAATAIIVVGLVAGLIPKWAPRRPAIGVVTSVSLPAVNGAVGEAVSLAGSGDDSSWRFVTELSGTMAADQVENTSLDPNPGSADEAAEQLSGLERRELVRLLKAELRENPTPSPE